MRNECNETEWSGMDWERMEWNGMECWKGDKLLTDIIKTGR